VSNRQSSLVAFTIAATSLAFWPSAPVPSWAASENAGFKSNMLIAQASGADSENSATALDRKLTAASEQIERLAAELATLATVQSPATTVAVQPSRKIPTREEIEAENLAKQLRDQLDKLREELRALKQRSLELSGAASRARARCQEAQARLAAAGASAGAGAAIGGLIGGPFGVAVGVAVGAAAGAAISGVASPPNPDDLDDCKEAARLEREAAQLDLNAENLRSEIQRINDKMEAERKRQQERRQKAVTRQDTRPSILLKPPHAVGKKETAAVSSNTSVPRTRERAQTKPVQATRKSSEQPYALRQKAGGTASGSSAMDRLSGGPSGGSGSSGVGSATKLRGSSNVAAPGSSSIRGGGGVAAPATSINRNAIGGGSERIR
jgi:hypothetical protein